MFCHDASHVPTPAMCRASRTAYGSLVVDWVSIRAASPWRRRKHASAELLSMEALGSAWPSAKRKGGGS